MSQQRAENIAIIDQALANGLKKPEPAPDDTTPDIEIAPGVSVGAPLSSPDPDESAGDDGPKDGKEELEEAKRLRQQAEEEKAQRDALQRTTDATVSAIQRIVRGTQVRLESLPQPGSIALPLTVLFVLFILILPVNGHTRFQWLWLVISGNAAVVPHQATADDISGLQGVSGGGADTGATITTGGVDLLLAQPGSPIYTHAAEDYL